MKTDATQPTAPESADLPIWDSLREVHRNLSAFSLVPGQLSPMLRERELIERVPDKAGLLAAATTLRNDVESFDGKLRQIYDQHGDRTGEATDPDDHMKAIQLFEQYLSWEERYRRVVLPNITHITQVFASLQVDLNNASNDGQEAVGVTESQEPVHA